MPHMNTSPDLVGYLAAHQLDMDRSSKSEGYSSINTRRKSGASAAAEVENLPPDELTPAQQVLKRLMHRQNENYRKIAFKGAKPVAGFQQRVSFDTINLEIADDLDSSDEEFMADIFAARRRLSNDMDLRGRGRDTDFLAKSPATSPSASPTRMISPLRSRDMLKFFSRSQQLPYPTTPIITRKGCTITRIHRDFENLYLGHLLSRGLCPVLPGRVILLYISGRKHTWVAIDWVLRTLVQHGDIVIIVSSIPHALGPKGSRLRRYPSPDTYQAMTPKVRRRQRNRPEYIKEIAANIMNYALTVVDPEIIVKITVEIAEGKTKDVLKDMYKLYEPNIVCSGSKSNVRKSAPLKSWNSSRLTDRLVKNFPLPVIVVPAANMGPYEKHLSHILSGKQHHAGRGPHFDLTPSTEHAHIMHRPTSGSTQQSPVSEALSDDESSSSSSSSSCDSDSELDSDSASLSDNSIRSQSSEDSERSECSYESFDEIADLYNEYKEEINLKFEKLKKRTIDENFFAGFLTAISDLSLRFCLDLRGVDPDFRGQGAFLARAITGSNSFGAVPYKTKSLLPPVESPKKTVSGNGSGISVQELKRTLKMNAEKARMANPLIQIELPPSGSDGPTKAPKASALKFHEGEKPKRRGGNLPLKKFLSHEDPLNLRVTIEPSKSHPDIHTTMEVKEKKKKKKRKFWKLF